MPSFPTPFTIPPLTTHTSTLILLHPLSSDGPTFSLSLLASTTSSNALLQTLFPGTKFIFPTANSQCVTALEGGPRMTQWFDNYSTIDPSQREALQFKGLRESSVSIHGIVEDEGGRVGLERVFLGGFGMGSAMALYALLSYRSDGRVGNLGGFVGMSGWLPLRKSLDEFLMASEDGNRGDETAFTFNLQMSNLTRDQIGLLPLSTPPPEYQKIPFFMAHGKSDTEVPVHVAEEAAGTLNTLGLNVKLKTYKDLGHEWRNGDEIDDIVSFLRENGMT